FVAPPVVLPADISLYQTPGPCRASSFGSVTPRSPDKAAGRIRGTARIESPPGCASLIRATVQRRRKKKTRHPETARSSFRAVGSHAGSRPSPAPPRRRGPLASGLLQRGQDAGGDLVHGADAIDAGQRAAVFEEADHRSGGVVVHLQALAHRLGIVVGAAFGLGAAGDALDQEVGRHV